MEYGKCRKDLGLLNPIKIPFIVLIVKLILKIPIKVYIIWTKH